LSEERGAKNKNAQLFLVHFYFAEALPTSNFFGKNRLDVNGVINNSNNFIYHQPYFCDFSNFG